MGGRPARPQALTCLPLAPPPFPPSLSLPSAPQAYTLAANESEMEATLNSALMTEDPNLQIR